MNTKKEPKISTPLRVRFAPSPTGYLHIGGARTALYSYLFSKSNQGAFILRVEDTDLKRSTEESLKKQLLDLKWLGLEWDEGPFLEPQISVQKEAEPITNEIKNNPKIKNQTSHSTAQKQKITITEKGLFGPYRQSERLSIYKKEAERLLKKNQAFYCFLTEEEWDLERKKAKDKGIFFEAKSPYRNLELKKALKRIEKGEKPSLRFKNDFSKDFILKDKIRGNIKLPSKMVGDFVLIRSNGVPVYNFCCVIDDVLMKISHVFRAEEHLSNTLRQLMIYEALNYPLPLFGHFSLVLGPDRQKLSKRHGACSIHEYKEKGYLPEALLNYIALLGWSSPEGKEILTLKDLITQFSLERLNPAPAIFDEKRLNWINATHLRSLDSKQLWKKLKIFFEKENLKFKEDPIWQENALNLFKSSMITLKSGVQLLKALSESKNETVLLNEEAKKTLKTKETALVLKAWLQFLLQSKDVFVSKENFKEFVLEVKKKFSIKGKNLFMPLRISIIGKPEGAELKDLLQLIPREKLIQKTKNLDQYLIQP